MALCCNGCQQQKKKSLEDASKCSKCGQEAKLLEESSDPAYEVGEILIIKCPSHICKQPNGSTASHAARKTTLLTWQPMANRLVTKGSILKLTPPPPTPHPRPPDPPTAQDLFSFLDHPVIDDTAAVSSASELLHDFGMTPDELIEVMEKELQGTHIEGGDSAMEVVDPPVSGDRRRHALPKIDMSGNE